MFTLRHQRLKKLKTRQCKVIKELQFFEISEEVEDVLKEKKITYHRANSIF